MNNKNLRFAGFFHDLKSLAVLSIFCLLCSSSVCLASSSSGNFILVSFSMGTSGGAEVSSNNNKSQVTLGENIVANAQSALYKSMSGYFAQVTATTLAFASGNVNNVFVYPNPFKPNSAGSIYQAEHLTFRNLPQKATIKIFNITGELVATLEKDSSLNEFQWIPKNDAGNRLSSGLYIFYATDQLGNKKTGKFTVIR